MIGEYRIGQQLGKGIDASCFLVEKEQLYYCMKVVSLFSSEKAKKERVENEIKVLKLLGSHQNIISFEGSFQTENFYIQKTCIVTEVMECNLANYLKNKNGRLNTRETKRIALQLLEGLHHMHSNLICHHDLKLENVMIDTETGTVKLIDFGMSSISSDETEIVDMRECKGTPLYVCPQKFSKSRYDGRKSDCWALGILLYRCYTGTFPFGVGSKDIRELAYSVINDDFKVYAKMNQKLVSFLNTLLCKDQQERFFAHEAIAHPLFCKRKRDLQEL